MSRRDEDRVWPGDELFVAVAEHEHGRVVVGAFIERLYRTGAEVYCKERSETEYDEGGLGLVRRVEIYQTTLNQHGHGPLVDTYDPRHGWPAPNVHRTMIMVAVDHDDGFLTEEDVLERVRAGLATMDIGAYATAVIPHCSVCHDQMAAEACGDELAEERVCDRCAEA